MESRNEGLNLSSANQIETMLLNKERLVVMPEFLYQGVLEMCRYEYTNECLPMPSFKLFPQTIHEIGYGQGVEVDSRCAEGQQFDPIFIFDQCPGGIRHSYLYCLPTFFRSLLVLIRL